MTEIELAPEDRTEALREYIDRILEALGHPEALVTDESKIWDFVFIDEPGRMDMIIERLEVPFTKNDYLVDVAERMKRKESG